MRAVILAAGEGSRMRPHFRGPKPLIKLLGLSLIERNILSLKECGITHFVIITGCYDRELKDYLGDGSRYQVRLTYLYNPDWKLGNGVSAYTFKDAYEQGEKFILLMADHIFVPELIKDFVHQAQKTLEDGVLLAADRRLHQVWDLEECTKIRYENDLALRLGKEIKEYNGVDCGLFAATGALLEALGQAIGEKKYTLTDAVNILAAQQKVRLHFVEKSWVDVDDLPSFREAERILLRSLLPAKDGLISKLINRKFSLPLTKVLSRTPITANQVTFLSLVTALAGAVSFALHQPLLGGLLAQFCSILDGVDGEIARLKFLKSNYGALFDAILDRYADYLLVLGMAWAWLGEGASFWAWLVSAAALTGIPMSMLIKEKYHALTGRTFIPEECDGFSRFLPANRDGRLFIIMLGGIFHLVPLALGMLAAVSHLQALIRLYRLRQRV